MSVKPRQAKPRQAKPSQAKPSQAEPRPTCRQERFAAMLFVETVALKQQYE
jgi:hypothetical protein